MKFLKRTAARSRCSALSARRFLKTVHSENLIVLRSAFALLVMPENLLEEQADFKQELCNAALMAGAGAIL